MKLTEFWKYINTENSPVKISVHQNSEDSRMSRSGSMGKVIEFGSKNLCLSANLNDSSRAWNKIPNIIKESKTFTIYKKKIRQFVDTLPL